MQSKRIFAATDLSRAGDDVVREADRIARLEGAQLIVFHAVPTYARSEPLFPQAALATNEAYVSFERQVLEQLTERTAALTGRAPETLDLEVGFGPADEEIVSHAAARAADLIVVGGEGPPRLARAVLGAVAEKVLHRAHCSVLVARPHLATHQVLVATDFSRAATLAVSVAALHARLDGARIWALHVLDDPDRLAPGAGFPAWGTAELARLTSRAQERLGAALEAAGAQGELGVAAGEPASMILDHAAELDVDFIVLGTTGQTGLALSRLGSVAEAVARGARCSVLVVRLLQG
jgi:nucleotide-binding universal stress UspA family protein